MMRALLFAVFACLLPLVAQEPESAPAPPNARLARITPSGQLLIIGNELRMDPAELPGLSEFPKAPEADLQVVPPGYFMKQRIRLKGARLWSIGQSWRIYPGSGAPARVSVSNVGYLATWCQIDYDGAFARFLNNSDAKRLTARKGAFFLAVPGEGWASVSQEPLIPTEDMRTGLAASLVMAERSRALLAKSKLERSFPYYQDYQEAAAVRGKLDAAFLASNSVVQITQSRWHPSGGPNLLFVGALWSNESESVFGATAIFVEGPPSPAGEPNLTLVEFDGRYGLDLRSSDGFHVETIKDVNVFLNAWRIDGRLFVLKQNWGYAGNSVSLEELNLASGLRRTPMSEAYGCD